MPLPHSCPDGADSSGFRGENGDSFRVRIFNDRAGFAGSPTCPPVAPILPCAATVVTTAPASTLHPFSEPPSNIDTDCIAEGCDSAG